ncbi:MAG TPA: LacI family DNA-binding transcriptional regulator [Dongiaceae bacterium]|jgi:LacI family gluconate utilization system Gnt-I transcriptional repressor|nr:LacI family DNA-binding transcriptional regulator [Dongiaceae bacterium]
MRKPAARSKGKPRRRARLSDVAAHAGVSAVTVSRAIRKPEMVSEDVRRRIDAAVHELGYVPNYLASALASAKTHIIGVVVPSLTNGVFVDYLRALHDFFLPKGFQVLVLNSRYSLLEEERALATLIGHHAEALIVAGIDQTERSRTLLESAGVPIVQTMEIGDKPIDINIGLSQHDAGYAATRYLLDLGHRKIAHIAARIDFRAKRRMEGYKQAMADAGIDCTDMVEATTQQSTVRRGAEMFSAVLSRLPDIEAIFCCNDDLALGALFECQRRGIRVPQDLSIVGFNDLEYCASAYPPLTSVAVPRYEMARQAAEIVYEIIRGSGARPKPARIDLGFKIVARGSTAQRRRGKGTRAAPAGKEARAEAK